MLHPQVLDVIMRSPVKKNTQLIVLLGIKCGNIVNGLEEICRPVTNGNSQPVAKMAGFIHGVMISPPAHEQIPRDARQVLSLSTHYQLERHLSAYITWLVMLGTGQKMSCSILLSLGEVPGEIR